MNKPVIAVVGRPNVGKSTLFNKLIGQRLSIVDDTPGVTRDRIYGEVEWCGKTAFIVDTGGIEPKSDDIILVQMRRQAQLAIDTANVIILVTDCKSGHGGNRYGCCADAPEVGQARCALCKQVRHTRRTVT